MKNILLAFLGILVLTVPAHAHPPWGIVVDDQGNIYFADIIHNGRGSVWKLTPKGDLELLLSDFHAHNVSLDADQHLVTAHGEGTHTMIRFLPNRTQQVLFQTSDYTEFNGGNSTYANGTIFFGAEDYLWKLNKKGEREKVSDHKFEWNQTIYAAPDGTLYAPDIGKGNGIIVKITPGGEAKILARNLISELERPRNKHNDILLGITQGLKGDIYIAEKAGQRIIEIASDGSNKTFYKSAGNWFPTAITFWSGCAYILEYKDTNKGMAGPRVIRFDKSGMAKILFNYDSHD